MDVHIRTDAANGGNVGLPIFQTDFRIVAALEQHRGRPFGCGGFDLFRQLGWCEQIRVAVTGLAEKGAKGASGNTNVGVVWVGVHHEGDPALGKPANPFPVSQVHQFSHGQFGKQGQCLVSVVALSFLGCGSCCHGSACPGCFAYQGF